MKLEAYIKRCEAVVHFVGDMTGSPPKDFGLQALLSRHPDIKTKLPSLGAAIDGGAAISYTQWEAWLALYFDKDLVIAAPGSNFARDLTLTPNFAPTEQCKAAQAAHLERLRALGCYPEVKFANVDNLVAQIFGSAVIDALVKAAAMLTRQPRNLPFASLGSLFMGRDTALDDLRAALTSGKGAAVTGRALYGLGGIGKTRLAIEYAHWRETDYSMLLFVRAKDRATLHASLAALAGPLVLNLPEKEAPQDAVKIEAVLKQLDDNPTWLMILDNADDDEAVEAVSDLMARLKGGHVIVTARVSNFQASLPTLELDVLEDGAAVEFLLQRTRGKRALAANDEAQARELAHELGGLALGLEQAGAYIARKRIGFARYLMLWREKRDSVLNLFDKTTMSYDHASVSPRPGRRRSKSSLPRAAVCWTASRFSRRTRSPILCWMWRFPARPRTTTPTRRGRASTPIRLPRKRRARTARPRVSSCTAWCRVSPVARCRTSAAPRRCGRRSSGSTRWFLLIQTTCGTGRFSTRSRCMRSPSRGGVTKRGSRSRRRGC